MLNPTHHTRTIGDRIARLRKIRGLTQHGLATRSAYSRGLIAQVEAGHKAPTAGFVAAMAASLRVPPEKIWGQPFQDENRPDHAVYAPIPDIRQALTVADITPDLDGPPLPLKTLAADLQDALRLRQESRHAKLGARLPGLLSHLSWHAHENGGLTAWRMLHSAYSVTASLTRRLGFTDLASVTQERSAVTALRCQDPNLVVMVAYRRALLMSAANATGAAVRLLTRSLFEVDTDQPDAVETVGSLHLRAAVVSARAGDAATAWDHHAQAEEVSARAGRPSLDVHGTDYSPENITIHGCAIAAELGDYNEAVRRDQAVTARALSGLAPERRAHHQVDMSRVRLETGDREHSLDRLLDAEKAAPQMVRYHPGARATVRQLADAYRTTPERLRGLWSRMRL